MALPSPFGRRLRQWRKSRHLSQLELAALAHSTTRYISFMENGRSRPSEQMVHRIADALGVTVRDRDELLVAAGFAAASAASREVESAARPYHRTIERIIASHEPYPAMVVNRWWDVVDGNLAAQRFFSQVDPKPVTNMIEWLFGADEEMKAKFENWTDTAYTMLRRIRRETVDALTDERLENLVAWAEAQIADVELPIYESADPVRCPTMFLGGHRVSLIGMVARFGTAREVSLDELRIEMMYPRDDDTDAYFRRLADRSSS